MPGVGNTFLGTLIEPNSLAYLALVVIAAPFILHILKAHFDIQAKDKLKVEKVNLLKDSLLEEAKSEEAVLLKELAFESIYKFRFTPKEIECLLKQKSPNMSFAFYKRFHKALEIKNDEVIIKDDHVILDSYLRTKASKFCKRQFKLYTIFGVLTYLTGQGAYYIRTHNEAFGSYAQFGVSILSIISLWLLCLALEKLYVGIKYQGLDYAYKKAISGL